MLTVENVAVLIGHRLDAKEIRQVVGSDGTEVTCEHDPGHQEDEAYCYIVPARGLEVLAGSDRIIHTVVCMLNGSEEVQQYDWSLDNGISRTSTRTDVRRIMGTPESSGKVEVVPVIGKMGAWDRYRHEPFGFIHLRYSPDGGELEQICVMRPDVAPPPNRKWWQFWR